MAELAGIVRAAQRDVLVAVGPAADPLAVETPIAIDDLVELVVSDRLSLHVERELLIAALEQLDDARRTITRQRERIADLCEARRRPTEVAA